VEGGGRVVDLWGWGLRRVVGGDKKGREIVNSRGEAGSKQTENDGN